MSDPAYQLEHALDVEVSLSFAWSWRTDVRTWDDPPAVFALDGPFAVGASGTTWLPGQAPLRWYVRDSQAGRSFLIDMPLEGAVLSFEWHFEPLSDRRTRITQRIVLSGPEATRYAAQVQEGFGPTLADGMKRIANQMVTAEGAGGQPI